jgi:hypothetical protein
LHILRALPHDPFDAGQESSPPLDAHPELRRLDERTEPDRAQRISELDRRFAFLWNIDECPRGR